MQGVLRLRHSSSDTEEEALLRAALVMYLIPQGTPGEICARGLHRRIARQSTSQRV